MLLAGVIGATVFGRGGLLDIRRQRVERAALSQEIFGRMRDNDELRRRLVRLRRSDHELENLARQELGLVRDGEIVYRFAPRAAAADPAPALARH